MFPSIQELSSVFYLYFGLGIGQYYLISNRFGSELREVTGCDENKNN